MKLIVFMLTILALGSCAFANPFPDVPSFWCLNCGQPISVSISDVSITNFTANSYPATNVSAGQFGQHYGNGSFTFTDVLNLKGNANLTPMCSQGLVLGNNGTGLLQCVNVSDAVDITGLDTREAENNNTQNLKMDANNDTLYELILLVNTTLNNSVFFNNLTVGTRIGALETLHGLDNITLGNRIGLLETLHGADNNTLTDELANKLNSTGNSTIEGNIIITGNLTVENNITANSGVFNYVDKIEITEPATPPANTLRLFVVNESGFARFNYKDEYGVVRTLNDDEIIVKNVRGTTIAQHRVVFVNGYEDGVPTVELAQANDTNTMPNICVTIETIANGSVGRCMQSGLLQNVNTASYDVGLIYVSEKTPGIPTNTAPVTPNLTQEIGTVLVKNATTGQIQIHTRAMTGDEYGTINSFIIQGNLTVHGTTHSLLGNLSIASDLFLGGVNITERINYNNDTQESIMLSRDGLKANLTNISTACGAGDYLYNVTVDLIGQSVTSLCRVDQVGGGGSATTGKVPWLYNDSTFMYYNETHLNFTTGIFANASRQEADNDTTSTRIGNLETLQSADNDTLTLKIDGNNNTLGTLISELTTKQGSDNVTTALRIDALESLHSNDNLTLGNRIGLLETLHNNDNNTINNALVLLRYDNDTQANLISVLDTRQSEDNSTTSTRIGNLETLHSADNDTQTDLSATKFNNTGGRMEGNLTVVGNTSTTEWFRMPYGTGICWGDCTEYIIHDGENMTIQT